MYRIKNQWQLIESKSFGANIGAGLPGVPIPGWIRWFLAASQLQRARQQSSARKFGSLE
jgi:hypothetical protein